MRSLALFNGRSPEDPSLSPGLVFHPEPILAGPGARRRPPEAEHGPPQKKTRVNLGHGASMPGQSS
eukprot:7058628-Pyramimonas_sp.AAC.1